MITENTGRVSVTLRPLFWVTQRKNIATTFQVNQSYYCCDET